MRSTTTITFTILLLAIATSAQAKLVGHWTFDQTPGVNNDPVPDVSGETVHDGILHTTLTDASASGIIGGAFNFTKPDTQNEYVSAELGADYVSGSNPASISMWIDPNTASGQNFFFAWGSNSAGKNVRLTLETAATGLVLRYRHQGGFTEFDASAMTLDNGWHQVASVVPEGATTVDDVIVYMDGQRLTKTVHDNDTLNVVDGYNTNLFIGSNWNGATAFDGLIDDVGWWNEALTDADIQAIYQGGLIGKNIQESLYGPGGPAADANGDGIVDAADYIIFKENFGSNPGVDGAGATVGDFNGDGIVDAGDLSVFIAETTAAGAAVPEPASAMLFVFGAGWLLRRRRTRAS